MPLSGADALTFAAASAAGQVGSAYVSEPGPHDSAVVPVSEVSRSRSIAILAASQANAVPSDGAGGRSSSVADHGVHWRRHLPLLKEVSHAA